ncbi:MAG: hypothetical protein ACRDYC_05775 [Acidimicrobiales bacterium]
MALTPPDSDRVPEVLARIDLHALVTERAGSAAHMSGGKATFHCPHPDHPDRHPSFTVHNGRWKCWAVCAAGGDAIDLLVWLGEAPTKRDAIEMLSRQLGIVRDSVRPAGQLSAGAQRALLQRYLVARNLPPEIVAELELSVVVDHFGRPRIRHPFRLRGEVVGWQDRAVEPNVSLRWLSSPGPVRCPYEVDRLVAARKDGAVVITEGVSDAVAVVAAFSEPKVVGIPGTCGFRAEWAPAFRDLVVFIAPDNDAGGETFARNVCAALRGIAREVRRVYVPPEFNDLGAWLVEVGDREVFAVELEANLARALPA